MADISSPVYRINPDHGARSVTARLEKKWFVWSMLLWNLVLTFGIVLWGCSFHHHKIWIYGQAQGWSMKNLKSMLREEASYYARTYTTLNPKLPFEDQHIKGIAKGIILPRYKSFSVTRKLPNNRMGSDGVMTNWVSYGSYKNAPGSDNCQRFALPTATDNLYDTFQDVSPLVTGALLGESFINPLSLYADMDLSPNDMRLVPKIAGWIKNLLLHTDIDCVRYYLHDQFDLLEDYILFYSMRQKDVPLLCYEYLNDPPSTDRTQISYLKEYIEMTCITTAPEAALAHEYNGAVAVQWFEDPMTAEVINSWIDTKGVVSPYYYASDATMAISGTLVSTICALVISLIVSFRNRSNVVYWASLSRPFYHFIVALFRVLILYYLLGFICDIIIDTRFDFSDHIVYIMSTSYMITVELAMLVSSSGEYQEKRSKFLTYLANCLARFLHKNGSLECSICHTADKSAKCRDYVECANSSLGEISFTNHFPWLSGGGFILSIPICFLRAILTPLCYAPLGLLLYFSELRLGRLNTVLLLASLTVIIANQYTIFFTCAYFHTTMECLLGFCIGGLLNLAVLLHNFNDVIVD